MLKVDHVVQVEQVYMRYGDQTDHAWEIKDQTDHAGRSTRSNNYYNLNDKKFKSNIILHPFHNTWCFVTVHKY